MKLSDDDVIIPFFQPIIAVDTRKISGYEVLGRVRTRDGVYSLGPFFHDPAVPEGAKVEADRLIRQKALELVAATGIKANVFLNIQPQWACSFLGRAERLPTLDYLQTYGIPGDQIVIEISEAGAFVTPKDLAELAGRYREAGCKVALDDFGLEFNNLERIFILKPDFLKISTALSGGTSNKAIFCSLLKVLGLFARETGLELMLEGVETETQFLEGLDAGVRYFQGYFFAPPQPGLLNEDGFAALVARELDRYASGKVKHRSGELEIVEQMNALLNDLSNAADRLDKCLCWLLCAASPSWIRVYVCDGYGYQQTPNYVRNGMGNWLPQYEYVGRNWCWRPYFLPYVVEAARKRQGVLSAEYLDLESHRPIRTFVYPLGADRFLFIDLDADSEGFAGTEERDPG
ncbi:MAG TPA: EAL domain-containing protein [Syntrophomonadaceae bacterium]|nr:EAL domain-containing protein [Syntrophomonadaceae bacterium]